MTLLKTTLQCVLAIAMILGFNASTALAKTEQIPNLVSYTIQLKVNTQKELTYHTNWLSQMGYDVAGTNLEKGLIEVITTPDRVEFLKKNQYKGQIKTQKWSDVGVTAIDPRYLDPAKVEQKLKDLNARFPQWTTLKQIGTSHQGRAIWALLVSTTPQVDSAEYYAKPSIIFDGMHHARELMTAEVVMDVAEFSLSQLESNGELAAMLGMWNMWIVPMLNVDGNNIVWTKSNMWRKNAREINGATTGVDLNRNYSFNWGKCNGSSTSPRSDTYRGPTAGSEPEAQALMNLSQFVIPTGSLSYHSYSEMVLYPYGCNGVVTGENALISSAAKELALALPSDSSSTRFYSHGTPWQLLYSVDGDSMSYMFGEFGALALTFEINQSFQPAFEVKEKTVQKHRTAWQKFLNRMTQNLLQITVVDSRTNNNVTAQIGISNIQLAQGEKPYRTNLGGVFSKVLDAGTYALTIQLADGRTKILNVEMTSVPQRHTVVVE